MVEILLRHSGPILSGGHCNFSLLLFDLSLLKTVATSTDVV